MSRPRILAFYLPQFHPIPENDEWWGKGFTEWTNVGRAKPLFPCHNQPRVPADLGYYDLRLPETREAQAELAKEAGIDGFCYWHYWFEPGKELLQRPFNEVVDSGEPDFPFCLAWANENWYAKTWDKDGTKKLLAEQKYLGEKDYTAHFYSLLKAFKDKRYIKQDGKPVFIIYKPLANSEIKVFMDIWQSLAKKEGLKGIYFISHLMNSRKNLEVYKNMGFDNVNICNFGGGMENRSFAEKIVTKAFRKIFRLPMIYSYKRAIKYFFDKKVDSNIFVCPTIITGWDHTPRSGRNGAVYVGRTPDLFYEHAKIVTENTNSPFIFVKSWNEWAEGNYLEPDLKDGKAYIEALKKAVTPPPRTQSHTYYLLIIRVKNVRDINTSAASDVEAAA